MSEAAASTEPDASTPLIGLERGDEILSTIHVGASAAYIPVPKQDLILTASGEFAADPETRRGFDNVCRLLAATLHYDFYETQEAMRNAYRPFDPDSDQPLSLTAAELDAAWARFDEALTRALIAANFEEIDADSEASAAEKESEAGVKVKTTRAGMRMIRHFVRNRRRARIRRRRWWGLRNDAIEADVFGDVIMVAGYKAEWEISQEERARMPRSSVKNLRPSCAFVKQFKNIARGDLISLHPGARITMKRSDQVMLAAPALFGGVPLIMNLLPALGVLFIVIGAYLGFQGGHVTHDATRKALAAVSGLVALGAFMMRQRLKYEAQSLRYQKRLSDNVYYRNVANNAGVFDILISAAEEQELKEAVAAYNRLLLLGPMNQKDLDKACEDWISRTWNVKINFEVQDALRKLLKMGLVTRENGLLTAAPPAAALDKLDTAWDAIFSYHLNAARPA
jgi:hypothetical protein